jgi:hypothetical protein
MPLEVTGINIFVKFLPITIRMQTSEMWETRAIFKRKFPNLFNGVFSTVGYTAPKEGVTVNDEWERMWKETVVDYFKVMFHYQPGGTEQNHSKDGSWTYLGN